jgi:hypothetical protein
MLTQATHHFMQATGGRALKKQTYYNTVVAIHIRSSKFRTGLFNDDRLAGQFKLRTDFSDIWNRRWLGQLKFRMELIGQARLSAGGCKLARSLSMNAGPPNTPSALLLVCVHGTRPLTHTSGNPASNLHPTMRLLALAPLHALANPTNSRPNTQRWRARTRASTA